MLHHGLHPHLGFIIKVVVVQVSLPPLKETGQQLEEVFLTCLASTQSVRSMDHEVAGISECLDRQSSRDLMSGRKVLELSVEVKNENTRNTC